MLKVYVRWSDTGDDPRYEVEVSDDLGPVGKPVRFEYECQAEALDFGGKVATLLGITLVDCGDFRVREPKGE